MWDSASLFLIFDGLIVAVAIFSISMVLRYYRESKQLGHGLAINLILFGFGVISLVYLVDLFSMVALPLLTSPAFARSVNMDLHLYWNRMGTLVAVCALSSGVIVLLRTFGTVMDVTDDRLKQDKRIYLERKQACIEMMHGVNHNLNNLLTGLVAPAEILVSSAKSDQDRSWAEIIHTSAQMANDLVGRLNDAFAESIEPVEAVDLQSQLELSVSTMRSKWQDNMQDGNIDIKVVTDLQQVPPVAAEPLALNNVFNSLILNAFEAMPGGGILTLTLRGVNGGVRINVQDTGIGMSAENIQKVFKPFFTTKYTIGSGLSLYKLHTAIGSWGGVVEVESTLGLGTTFKMYLPEWTDTETKVLFNLKRVKRRVLPAG